VQRQHPSRRTRHNSARSFARRTGCECCLRDRSHR
jgi:hypothetical protein